MTATQALLTTQEAAHALNLRPQTLRAWSMSGRGPLQPVRISARCLRWRASDISRLIGADVAVAS